VNDELQWRINEHVLNGDAPSIIWAMERQIRINTELEVKVAELERREALLTAVVGSFLRWKLCQLQTSYIPDMDAMGEGMPGEYWRELNVALVELDSVVPLSKLREEPQP
jgi:hypothetical protein